MFNSSNIRYLIILTLLIGLHALEVIEKHILPVSIAKHNGESRSIYLGQSDKESVESRSIVRSENPRNREKYRRVPGQKGYDRPIRGRHAV